MAFNTAANYFNLPNGNFVATIYSKKVQKAFRKESIAENITNTEFFGEIKNWGDTVRIIKEPEVNVTPYLRGAQLTAQDLVDEDFTLTIDRANSFMFKMDDIEKAQAHTDWMDMAADRASYRLKDAYDADTLGYMSGFEKATPSSTTWVARTAPVGTKAWTAADADELLPENKFTRATFVAGGSASESIAVGTKGTRDATPLEVFNRINTRMNLLNVPMEGRWAVIDPIFAELLMDEDSKFIGNDWNLDQNAGGQLTKSKLVQGMVRGFKIYISNNLPTIGTGPGTADNNGSNANYGVIVAGQDQAVATAQQIEKTERYRDPNSFADIVRGLHLYGRKILRPEGLVRVLYNRNQ